jgi:hypothetical protein
VHVAYKAEPQLLVPTVSEQLAETVQRQSDNTIGENVESSTMLCDRCFQFQNSWSNWLAEPLPSAGPPMRRLAATHNASSASKPAIDKARLLTSG